MNGRRLLRALQAVVVACGAVAASAFAAPAPEPTPAQPPPPATSAGWQAVTLPSVHGGAGSTLFRSSAWVWIAFERPAASTAPWAVYLPYCYGGGEVWLNGRRIASIPMSSEALRVRWERPHLLTLPDSNLHDGRNDLMLRVVPAFGESELHLSRIVTGPVADLSDAFDRRFFWARTAPQITSAACLIVAAFVMFIWWRRPAERLYGLFGIATACWGVRSLTFVIELVPADRWALWRCVYLASTGGFVVAMAVFAARLAGLHRRRVAQALGAYWLAGPLWLLIRGARGEALVNRVWIGGLLPIGCGIVILSFWTVWRQRTWLSAVLPVALTLATLAGVHDYLIAWRPDLIDAVAPGWAGERLFLLHHGANLVLLAMGTLLALRFTQTLASLQQLNESLEGRIAEKERSLADNYVRLAALERQNAAAAERQLIMREIHDGLGSKLFTSLSRVERGAMDSVQMADSLRACIADMRLALDALAPEDHDLQTAFGDFMFRWHEEFSALGVRLAWTIELPAGAAAVPPQTTVQLLRIAQEALTNIAKHARAAAVHIVLRQSDAGLRLEVADDGVGMADAPSSAGRGIANMRTRAGQLGGTLELLRGAAGTRIVFTAPLKAPVC